MRDAQASADTILSDHFTNMKPFVDSGAWKMGGTFSTALNGSSLPNWLVCALLNEVPADDDAAKFKFAGSTLVCIGESKEEIIDMLRKDIYATSGVWDVDKVGQ